MDNLHTAAGDIVCARGLSHRQCSAAALATEAEGAVRQVRVQSDWAPRAEVPGVWKEHRVRLVYPRSGYLCLLKWAGSAACLVILLLSLIGVCSNLTLMNRAGTQGAGLSGGVLWIGWRSTTAVDAGSYSTYGPARFNEVTTEGFRLGFPARKWLSYPSRGHLFQGSGVDPVQYIVLPLSLPFALLLIPTVLLWLLDRRRMPASKRQLRAITAWFGNVACKVDGFSQVPRGRRLLIALTFLSGIGALAAATLWWLSYQSSGQYHAVFHISSSMVAHVESGWLCLWLASEWPPPSTTSSFEFGWVSSASGFYARDHQLVRIPLVVPTLLLTAVAVYPWLPPFRRLARARRGQCVRCAYDLTGNESGVCPECGTKIEKP